MKKAIVVIFGLLLMLNYVFAQNNELPQVNVLPDSPLYGIVRAVEQIKLWLTFDEGERAELQLEFALRRLAEAKAMEEKNKTAFVPKLLEEYKNGIIKVNLTIQREKMLGMNTTTLENRMNAVASKNKEIFEKLSSTKTKTITVNKTKEEKQEMIIEEEEIKEEIKEKNESKKMNQTKEEFIITITKDWEFEPHEITVESGKTIEITFVNENPADHTIVIGEDSIEVPSGKNVTVEIEISGKNPITFISPADIVAGHSGMNGRIKII